MSESEGPGPTGAGGDIHIAASGQLRLSALLDELRADAARRQRGEPIEPPPPTEDGERAAATIAPGAPVVIDSRDGLTLAEILDATAGAGFGFVIALLALTGIPFVGLSTPFGLSIAFVGAQLLLGRTRPWLPQRIRAVRLSVAALDRIARWLGKGTRWMAPLVRQRLRPLTGAAGLAPIGLGLVILGIGLALPLPIPGSNLVFIVPILVYALGLLERDGVLVLAAHLMTAAHIALAILAWAVVTEALSPVARWLGW